MKTNKNQCKYIENNLTIIQFFEKYLSVLIAAASTGLQEQKKTSRMKLAKDEDKDTRSTSMSDVQVSNKLVVLCGVEP